MKNIKKDGEISSSFLSATFTIVENTFFAFSQNVTAKVHNLPICKHSKGVAKPLRLQNYSLIVS